MNEQQCLARLVLLAHCAVLSDSCRLTLQTMAITHALFGKFPSLSELAEKRGLAKSTVKAHLDEAVESGLLTRKQTNQGSPPMYRFEWDELAKRFSLKNDGSAVEAMSVLMTTKISAVVTETDPQRAVARVKTPRTRQELCVYIEVKIEDACGEPVTLTPLEVKLVSSMVQKNGFARTLAVIDYFFEHKGKLRLGGISVTTVANNFAHLEESMHAAKQRRGSSPLKRKGVRL